MKSGSWPWQTRRSVAQVGTLRARSLHDCAPSFPPSAGWSVPQLPTRGESTRRRQRRCPAFWAPRDMRTVERVARYDPVGHSGTASGDADPTGQAKSRLMQSHLSLLACRLSATEGAGLGPTIEGAPHLGPPNRTEPAFARSPRDKSRSGRDQSARGRRSRLSKAHSTANIEYDQYGRRQR